MGAQLDTELAALAGSQHGVVSLGQLLALGFGRRAVARRIERGRLHRLHRGVYAVGHRALSREARWLAAAMACGEHAVLSHATAANVWGLRRSDAARIDVSVPSTGGRIAPAGVRLHRRRRLEATTVGALPVTTVAQTLLDLATIVPQRAVERALEEAEAVHLDTTGLTELLAVAPHAHGAPRVRAALRAHGAGGVTLTRSELEERFLALCDEHGIPRPVVNRLVAGHEVDFSWPGRPLVVEADGYRHHRTRDAFERDRARDARLVAAGWTILRVTHRRLVAEPASVAADVAAALTRR